MIKTMTKMSNSCCFSTLLFAFAIIVVGNAIKIECQIIGGYSSNKSQFPFYVYLRTVLNGTINGNCGGVLLSSEWILTAAHCLDDTDKVQAHFGSWQREQYDEVGRLIYGIRQKYFHVHPQYDANGWKNDIALIRMRNPLLLQPGSIEAVIFPNTCSVDADEELIAIGNGYIKNGTTEMASVLQYGTLTTTTREECKKKFKWIDEEKVFCAKGYDGKERICYGDSGGPIVHPFQHTLYGITSLVVEDCPPDQPQIFTNIFAYSKWINDVTGTHFERC